MGFLDTFSRKFGFTTDEDENVMDEDENEIDDEEDEDEEEETLFAFRFPSFKRKASSRTARGRYEEDDEEEEEAPRRTSKRSNVIHDSRMGAQAADFTHCERIIQVRQIEECREIIRFLLRGESILLNLENVDPKDCGRVVDLLSGAAFALQGRMLKIAHLSYLLAPENVEVIKENLYADNQARYRG